jgi:predicted TPR repeat methyltransferase
MRAEALALADRAQLAGLLADAEAVCREILDQNPSEPQAMRILGVVCRKSGRLGEALEYLKNSVAGNPTDPLAYRDLGDALRADNKFDESVAAYERAIKLKPDWAEGYGAMGNVLKDAGKLDQAARAFTTAIRLRPELAMAHLRLGEVLHEQNRLDQARIAIARAQAHRPNWPEAFNSLGNLLWDEQKFDEAIAAYSEACRLRPGYPLANWSLGKLLTKRGQHKSAIECFQTVVEAQPADPLAHFNLARARRLAGEIPSAREAYRRAIELAPDRADWKFELAACAGDGSAQTIPENYVRELFDDYSATFDEHLVKTLHYRVPEMFLAMATKLAPETKFAHALDLGCGTGLCGQAIRPIVDRLSGVDLSQKMIRVAQSRGVYDHLAQGELFSALREPNAFDLILAGDVLIYVGDLKELIPAVAAALAPGGLFLFSIEHFDGPGFFLHKGERFAHSIEYIREIAGAAQLRELSAEQIDLRRHADKQTPGWIIALAK